MTADFDLNDFLAWARTKPADEEYDFCDPESCAAAQFGRDTGREHLIQLSWFELRRPHSQLADAALGSADGDWTFGALVKRLEALCPSDTWTKVDSYLIDIEQVSV